MRHLMTNGREIVSVPKIKPIRSWFCRHKNQISGLLCSEIGLMRISGEDRLKVCKDCGKILEEHHIVY